jgi:hypothetical protein
MARARSAKFEIDKNRKAKAAEKRERRQSRAEEPTAGDDAGAELVDASSVMEQLSALHRRFDDGEIEFEQFEEEKAQLLARLSVD